MNKFDKVAYNKEYNSKKYKQLKVEIKPENYSLIDNFCKNNNISKASFIVKSCKYIIDNNIQFKE